MVRFFSERWGYLCPCFACIGLCLGIKTLPARLAPLGRAHLDINRIVACENGLYPVNHSILGAHKHHVQSNQRGFLVVQLACLVSGYGLVAWYIAAARCYRCSSYTFTQPIKSHPKANQPILCQITRGRVKWIAGRWTCSRF
jgi:hypothetical protein